jgi:hypothetical protein
MQPGSCTQSIVLRQRSTEQGGRLIQRLKAERQADMQDSMARVYDGSHPTLQARVLQIVLYQQACLPQPPRISPTI